MQKLMLLYFGTFILMKLSDLYYPMEHHREGHRLKHKNFMWQKSDIFMVLTITWMTCFSFLRTSYNDTFTYIMTFRDAETVAEGIKNGTFVDWTGNPWSMLYRSLMHDLTDNFHIYFFFPAFLSSLAVVKLVKKYSVNPALSLLLFFSIGTYIMYVAALKQCLAMFFLLLSLPYAIEKKYVRFYLLVLVAIMFHTHSFMFAIVPLLLEKPWGKNIWFLLGATVFAMLTYDSTLGAFMEYAQSLGALVAEEEVFDGHQINILRVLVYWIPALFALIFRQRLFSDSSRTENLFVNLSIVSAFILTLGLVQAANLFARMAGYFEIATIIALPWMIEKLFTKRSVQLVTGIASVLYFGYFCYEFIMSKNFDAEYSAITLWQFIQSLLS